jgi:hypothetical protein
MKWTVPSPHHSAPASHDAGNPQVWLFFPFGPSYKVIKITTMVSQFPDEPTEAWSSEVISARSVSWQSTQPGLGHGSLRFQTPYHTSDYGGHSFL